MVRWFVTAYKMIKNIYNLLQGKGMFCCKIIDNDLKTGVFRMSHLILQKHTV